MGGSCGDGGEVFGGSGDVDGEVVGSKGRHALVVERKGTCGELTVLFLLRLSGTCLFRGSVVD